MNDPTIQENIKHKVTIEKQIGNTYFGMNPELLIGSAINELLNNLSSKPRNFQAKRRRPSADAIVKIEYNNLRSRQNIVQTYQNYCLQIEESFLDIDTQIINGKTIILENLQNLYFEVLDELEIDYLSVDEIDINKIRENSDTIIDYIILKLKNLSVESRNCNLPHEVIDIGIKVIVAHAFIECIIMENPNP
ncbi:hypothetical protein FK538_03520 [Acinetobacter indicus]|uniref:hypothetical protein n=1 Tax=Acinetobacter indicus TaxID=756892 RepID=UPI00143FBABC|nr:hypothetical protein [Acinetobacter indicus]QIZ61123.1 hypothetical protein FK538_03520 [Acinetobacter indicus]